MALTLTAKPSGAEYRYTYTPPLAEGDSIASYVLTESGCTIASDETTGDTIQFFVTGGTDGSTASIAVSVVTVDGETLTETLYIPIIADAATGMTVRDAVDFALRKVFGLGNEAPADATDDAVEKLSDMLTLWRDTGADVGATFPMTAATVIYCKPSFQLAIKNNLAVQVADHYNLPLTANVALNAARGMQHVRIDNLPAERPGADFF